MPKEEWESMCEMLTRATLPESRCNKWLERGTNPTIACISRQIQVP